MAKKFTVQAGSGPPSNESSRRDEVIASEPRGWGWETACHETASIVKQLYKVMDRQIIEEIVSTTFRQLVNPNLNGDGCSQDQGNAR